MHRHDQAWTHLLDDRGRLRGVDRGASADREEEDINAANRLALAVTQLRLAEVAEVGDPQAVELEDEDRVRSALGARRVVVLGSNGEDLSERRLQASGGRARIVGVPPMASTPLWSPCSCVTSSRSAVTP